MANPDRYLHNLITKSQLEAVEEDNKPIRSTKGPELHDAFKQTQVQEQYLRPEHRKGLFSILNNSINKNYLELIRVETKEVFADRPSMANVFC